MAWKDISSNGYKVLETTIRTIESLRSVYTDEFAIPPGRDFWVISNYDATNLSASAHVEIWASDKSGGTFIQIDKTPFISLTGELDSSRKMLKYDISTNGQYPVYKLKVGEGGGLVKFVVMSGALAVD